MNSNFARVQKCLKDFKSNKELRNNDYVVINLDLCLKKN